MVNSSQSLARQAAGFTPLTVLVVNVTWPPETFISQTLSYLNENGLRVQLVVSTAPGARLPKSQLEIIKQPTWNGPWFHRVASLSQLLFTKLVRHPSALLRMVRLVASDRNHQLSIRERLITLFRLLPFVGLKPDVIHFQWNATAIEFRQLFDFFQCPTVVSCRGSQVNVAPHNPRRTKHRDGLRESFTRATAVHCVSEAIKLKATQFGLDQSKARIITPGVDTDFFQSSGAAHEEKAAFRVVAVGSLGWVKGYEFALLAVRQLLNAGVDVQFDIIGSGSDRQRLLYTIHDLGLVNHVHLHGKLSPTDVRECLNNANAFLLSSLSEGISNAVLEGMSCGLPVVTTDCGGMREVITNGVEGFVVPTRDAKAMADALHRLATDRELRIRMGQAARQRVARDFNRKQHGDQFLDLYASLVDSSTAIAS